MKNDGKRRGGKLLREGGGPNELDFRGALRRCVSKELLKGLWRKDKTASMKVDEKALMGEGGGGSSQLGVTWGGVKEREKRETVSGGSPDLYPAP